MKKFLSTSIIVSMVFVVFCLTLSGCAAKRYPYPNNQLAQEDWVNAIDKNTMNWTRGADRWFLTGDPNATERENRHAPASAGISTMMVKVSNFDSIKINGDFQVQLFSTDEHSSVYVYGPQKAVRSVMIDVDRNTLSVMQAQDALRPVMKEVIIRIGVNYLTRITQLGCGMVEGIRLRSDALYVSSSGVGNMYLAGNVNVRQVSSSGAGSVNLFGAHTGSLNIMSYGSGAINVSGNVGIKSIVHRGSGDINVVGANSNRDCQMKIYADGSGKIRLSGRAAIAEIIAKGHTCVFACPIISSDLRVCTYDSARVGLSGVGRNLFVETKDNSRFMGQRLCVENAYARAHGHSHINVTASRKVFASASESASIYFYGERKLMSQFVKDDATILPMSTSFCSCPVVVGPPVTSYKGEG